MNFIPLNGWPQLKDIPEKLEHFREVYARFAKVNRWYRSIEETELTGNPVIFYKALKLNALELNVDLLPIQSGSGDPSPTNVRPISGRTAVNVGRGGKNLLPIYTNSTYTLNGITFTQDENGVITANGTATDTTLWRELFTFTGGRYILSGGVSNNNFVGIQKTDFNYAAQAGATESAAFDLPTGQYYKVIRIGNGQTVNNMKFYPMLRDAATADDTYEPYIAPVTLTIALGTTVYGGTLDVKRGVLTIDRLKVKGNTITWIDNTVDDKQRFRSQGAIADAKVNQITDADMICSKFATNKAAIEFTDNDGICIHSNGYMYVRSLTTTNLTDFETLIADADICYELATPTTVQLTGEELEMLKGYNYISTDADSLTVKAYTI